jgi:hypothetical protein
MIVETQISYGYVEFLKVFFKANNLDVTIRDMTAYPNGKIILEYEDNSETAYSITFMSVRHLGFENMLCDYLIKCGVPVSRISHGKASIKRDMAEVDKEWEEKRRELGFR